MLNVFADAAAANQRLPGSRPSKEDLNYMRRAIELARVAAVIPGAAPIGCVIVRDGEIIGEGYNEVDLRHDPTAHAEIVAMRRVGAGLGSASFDGATLYSTLQPCGMCSMACIWSKIAASSMAPGAKTCIACISKAAISTPSISSPTPSATISA